MEANHFIIAIGGSAGAVEALMEFFDQTTAGQASYIIIRHMPENYLSQLKDILKHHTSLSIVNVDRIMSMKINTVFIGPSDRDLVIQGGRLRLVKKKTAGAHHPVDLFFQSLADCAIDKKAIAVVLSGIGSDGTKGVRYIKNAGGMVIAQTPASCRYDQMPQYAIDSGFVDYIETPSNMPGIIRAYTGDIEKRLE